MSIPLKQCKNITVIGEILLKEYFSTPSLSSVVKQVSQEDITSPASNQEISG